MKQWESLRCLVFQLEWNVLQGRILVLSHAVRCSSSGGATAEHPLPRLPGQTQQRATEQTRPRQQTILLVRYCFDI